MNREQNKFAERYERSDIAILVMGCVLVFFALGDRALWGAEGRWATITREMMLTGDYFHPTINGEPYFDKPLLTYWLIAALAFISGALNELIVRLPSAIAGVAAVWATLRLGRQLWSPAVGRIAAMLLLTSYGLISQSRMAAADTENLATVMLAILWYWLRRDKNNFITFMVLYLIVFIGSLCKGPVAAVVTAIGILPDAIGGKRWKAFFRPSSLFALAIGIAIYFAPFIWSSGTTPASYTSSGLALVWQENVQRFFSPFDHKEPFYTYIYSAPMLILPWAPLFIAAIIAGVKYFARLDKNTHWLIKVMVLIFVFFTLSGSRRSYYILPIIPFCALLTAVILTRMKEFLPSCIIPAGFTIQKWVIFGAAVLELLVFLALLIVPPRSAGVSLVGISLAGILVALAAIAAAIVTSMAAHRLAVQPEEKAFLPLAAVAFILMGGFFCVQQNAFEECRSEHQFINGIQNATAWIPPDRVGLMYKGAVDAKMVFYLDKGLPVTLFRYKDRYADKNDPDKKAIMSFLQSDQLGVFIAQMRYVAAFPAELSSLLPATPTFEEKPVPFESKQSREERWGVWLLNNQNTTPGIGGKTTNEK
ncbi:MAG: glycosyltransferase family 39 protein [Candidatus Brocadia sp.]|nr:glycosyltransferase family 39 protein [Candidatus Brocadia sp.]